MSGPVTPNTAAPSTLVLSVPDLATRHPGLSIGGLRWALFHAETNGLAQSGSILRLGRRVLIDEVAFLNWLRSNARAVRAT